MSELPPQWIDDPSALVIVDWSWWLNQSFHLFGVDGMAAHVVGRLTSGLLAKNPAHVAVALDSAAETHRHRATHPRDPEWRYKAGRTAKPAEFFAVARRLERIVALHAIPMFYAQGYEADDCIAAATHKAIAAGYRVYIHTADKDLEQLVCDDGKGVPLVIKWDGEKETTAADVERLRKVPPRQWGDALAICGDGVDAVPGVDGLGHEKAAALIRYYGSLDEALARAPWTLAESEAAAAKIKTLESERGKLKRKSLPTAEIDTAIADAREARDIAKWHATLCASGDVARFSRDLVALDHEAPIDWDPAELPVGGFDADALREEYMSLGFRNKAEQVTHFHKPPPWGM